MKDTRLPPFRVLIGTMRSLRSLLTRSFVPDGCELIYFPLFPFATPTPASRHSFVFDTAAIARLDGVLLKCKFESGRINFFLAAPRTEFVCQDKTAAGRGPTPPVCTRTRLAGEHSVASPVTLLTPACTAQYLPPLPNL